VARTKAASSAAAFAGRRQPGYAARAAKRRLSEIAARLQLPAVRGERAGDRQQVEPLIDEVEDQMGGTKGDEVRQGGLAEVGDQRAVRLGLEPAGRPGGRAEPGDRCGK
jgi:hypothetical protein